MLATDIAYAGLAQQAQLVRDGELTAVELTQFCLGRIEQLDGELNAFREVMVQSALDEAAERDRQLAAGDDGPLLGVPIAIKDDTDVEGVVTMHGGAAFTKPATADMDVVRRLRQAGAVIIGKTNLPEFGQWPFTESSAHGYTRNPWNPQHVTGGSSGGTAAAVASGMVAAGLGSDGGGSVRIPAACCGLFGLKPQRGRISGAPLVELWESLGVYGPLTRSVLDSAIFFDAVRGNVPADRYKADEPSMSFVEAATTAPGRMRIAVCADSTLPGIRLDREQRAALERTAEQLRALGHDVVETKPDYPFSLTAFLPQTAAGVRSEIAAADRSDLIERRTKQNTAITGFTPRSYTDAAIKRGERMATRVNKLFDSYDLLLTPTIAAKPRKVGALDGVGVIGASLRSLPYIAYTLLWNVTGNPAASVPAGMSTDGLPLAVQLVGAPNGEPTILQVAAQLEQAQPWAQLRPND